MSSFISRVFKKQSKEQSLRLAPSSFQNVKVDEFVEYDPIKERKVERPTTKFETLMNLIISLVGTGIYTMPKAFSYTGLVTGVVATIFTAIVITHTVSMLLQCSLKLCREVKRPSLTFSEVGEVACEIGPAWSQPWGKFLKHLISIMIGLTYFGCCSVYTVIVAENFEQVVRHYFNIQMDVRIYIAILLVPNILLCYVPHLKYLAPLSAIANVMILIGISITFYYCFKDMPPLADQKMTTSIMEIPAFFGITVFAMESIGIILPLENDMKKPKEMTQTCGVLNFGMIVVTFLYGLLGFVGYARYGADTQGSITLNLPVEDTLAQIVKLLVAIAVYFSIAIQFYVPLEIIWDGIKDKFTTHSKFYNYVLRTVLITAAVLVAIVVPTIAPFANLIGAFCFSIVGLYVPVFIEIVTCWENGFGKWNWIIWKNILICIFATLALVLGTKDAVTDIAKLYTKREIHRRALLSDFTTN